MNKKYINFRDWCRILRVEKGLTMAKAAKMLGCKQNHITQIEHGKCNPKYEYIEKCLKIYEVPNNEKADFVAKALANSKQITFKIENVTTTPKEDLVKLLAVLLFNLEEPYPNNDEWFATINALNIFKKSINNRQ